MCMARSRLRHKGIFRWANLRRATLLSRTSRQIPLHRMRPRESSARAGVISIRVIGAIVLLAIGPFIAFAAAPSWWSTRGVLTAGVQPNDYGPANQGQLKNIAKAAAAELDAQLP